MLLCSVLPSPLPGKLTALFSTTTPKAENPQGVGLWTSNMGGGIHPPLSVIGSWPPANLVDPVLRSNTNSIVIITFLVLAGLTIGARLWARGIIQRNLAFEDYLIIGAYVSALAMAIGSVLGTWFLSSRSTWGC